MNGTPADTADRDETTPDTDTRVYTGPDSDTVTADSASESTDTTDSVDTTDANHSADSTADSAPTAGGPGEHLTGTGEPRPIDDHPLRSEFHAIGLQTDNPTFEGREAMLTVEQLREQYQTVLAESGPWIVFTVDVYGHDEDLYLWNDSLGWGLLFPNAATGEDHDAVSLLDTFADAVTTGLDGLHGA